MLLIYVKSLVNWVKLLLIEEKLERFVFIIIWDFGG